MTLDATTTALRVALDYRPALLGHAGIARSVRELARALAAGGDVEPKLFGHSFARCRTRPAAAASGALHRLPIPGRSLPLLTRLGLGADRLCGGADVFHWTDYIYPPVRSARVVVTVHDVSFAEDPTFHGDAQSDTLLARCRAAVGHATRVVCPTHATADAAVRHLGVDRGRVDVVPFGVDHVARPAAGPHPRGGRPFALALGTIEPRKNHARLLEAWRALGADRPDLVIIGRRGWECDGTCDAIERAARTENVTWLQDADDADVRTHLVHAAVLAYPSLLEGFGFPPLEALALGVPVVCGDTPAVREVCGAFADYADPRDTDAITRALAHAIDHGPRRGAREHAATYTWTRCAQAHARVYREAATA